MTTMRLAGILTKDHGYPVDDLAAMAPFILGHAIATCHREGFEPRGTLTVQAAIPATINGQPLFEDDTSPAYRWEMELA